MVQADDYKTTGCLNVICPGFVVLSQTASPVMVLSNGFATAAISISKVTNHFEYDQLNSCLIALASLYTM